MTKHRFSTRQIHAEGHSKPFNAHTFPIFQTSTFYFDTPEKGAELFQGQADGYIYTRLGNPTIDTVEKVVADLEGGAGSTATSSGMAAVLASVFSFLNAGDHIVVSDTLYGASTTLLTRFAPRFGIRVSVVRSADIDQFKSVIEAQTRVVYIETPANPTLSITDIQAVADLAGKVGALVVVDNTFATPFFQNPLSLGADVVVHSATKYLNGHGDVVMGFVVARVDEHHRKMRDFVILSGGNANPFDAFLCLRGIKTLSIRMERHDRNARRVAEFLAGHPKIGRVYYPGLPDFPGHEIARRQMRGFSSVIAFDIRGGYDAGKQLMKEVRMMTLAVSLGTLDTLIQHPASMTHSGVPREEREKAGIADGLIRLSVGLEDIEDIIEDLEEALARV